MTLCYSYTAELLNVVKNKKMKRFVLFIGLPIPATRAIRFSEKPIVAFTNITIFILDFSIYYLACLVSCFGFKPLEFEESSVSYQKASAQITNICLQGNYLTN